MLIIKKIYSDYILAHLGLVGMVLRGIECPFNETYEDLFNEGILGLYDAVIQYNPNKGGAFSSFATKCIRYKIFNYLRKNANKPPIYLEDQNEIGDVAWMDIDARIDLEIALYSLPIIEKDVICRIYYHVQTLKEIGNQLGLSHTTIARVRDRAIRKLKRCQGI